jgi:hypothetical protein
MAFSANWAHHAALQQKLWIDMQMLLCETALEKAQRHVLEAERRITGQVEWIDRLLRMSYHADDERDRLDAMRQGLRLAHAEQARLQAVARDVGLACEE